MPVIDPPWDTGEWDQDRECARCGGLIPAKWRHYWEPCSCTYLPPDRPPHLPDPACEKCAGTGFLPCQAQDLHILRRWGYCADCGEPASVLIGEQGEIEYTAIHHNADLDRQHTVVQVVAGPLVKTVGDYLDRATQRREP